MITDKLPRTPLAHLPTPLEPLERLTDLLEGPEIWIKRDDQTGLATGGNKARKLEFLVGDALKNGADHLITCGAAQSNHARQTAAAAAKLGLECTLVLRGTQPENIQGNLLLDLLLGANIIWAGDVPIEQVLEQTTQDYQKAGKKIYEVPYGGSKAMGACGYVAAMEELMKQCAEQKLHFDHIVFATSSSGTQAGLVVGAKALNYTGQLIGISIEPTTNELTQMLSELATDTAALLGLNLSFSPNDFFVNDEYLGEGYGIVSDLERNAIRQMAQTEGIILDPVYTGRAFGALLDLVSRQMFTTDERVLFWHTGGMAGLFGYGESSLMQID